MNERRNESAERRSARPTTPATYKRYSIDKFGGYYEIYDDNLNEMLLIHDTRSIDFIYVLQMESMWCDGKRYHFFTAENSLIY